jgi:hypothetical protein
MSSVILARADRSRGSKVPNGRPRRRGLSNTIAIAVASPVPHASTTRTDDFLFTFGMASDAALESRQRLRRRLRSFHPLDQGAALCLAYETF